jgi:hypothetical protein
MTYVEDLFDPLIKPARYTLKNSHIFKVYLYGSLKGSSRTSKGGILAS